MAGYTKGSLEWKIDKKARKKYGRRARRICILTLLIGVILGVLLCYYTPVIPAIHAWGESGAATGLRTLFGRNAEISVTAVPTEAPVLPTETPAPIETPVPTETPAPVETPVPTEAPVIPTEAPIPVETPVPTETPAPVETPAPTETPAPVETVAPAPVTEPAGIEEAVAPGEWFSFGAQIAADGTAGGEQTVNMGVRVTGYLLPADYKAKYEGIYQLHGTEAAVVLEIRNDSDIPVSPQKALRLALENDGGDIYDSYPLMDADLGGRTSVNIAPGETVTVYKRFAFVEGNTDPYLTVTYTVNGAAYKTYYNLRPLQG